jgi:hypothetical protein
LRAWAEAVLARQHGRFAPWLAVALGGGMLVDFAQPAEPGLAALWAALPLAVLAVWLAR